MNAQLQQNLERLKREKIHIEFEQVLDFAWQSWKKITLKAALVFLLVAFIFLPLLAVYLPFLYGMTFEEMISVAQSNPAFFEGIQGSADFTLKSALIGIGANLLFAPINVGIMRMAYNYWKGQEIKINDAFYYFRMPYLGKIIAFVLLTALISALFSVLAVYVHSSFNILGGVISFLVSIFFFFALPLMCFGDAGFIESLRISFSIVSKKVWLVLGILIVSIVFMLAGFLACCIGFLFSLSFIHTAQFALYKELFMQESAPEAEITESDSI